MSYIFVLIGVLLLIVLFNTIIKAKLQKEESGDGASDVPYFRKAVLTEVEQVLYHRLVEALPELIILAQVPMSGLVGIRKQGNKNWQGQFNAISKKSVDYVVCRKDFSVVAVIELDDSTHEAADRQQSDAVKNAAFKQLGIKILRLQPGNMPAAESIAVAFATFLKKQDQHPPLNAA